MIDSHRIAEHARLLSHRIYAERLQEDPSLLEAARAAMSCTTSDTRTVGEEIWLRLLRAELREIIRDMLDEGEQGRLLRANSPFSIIIGIDNPDARKRSEER